MNTMNYLKKMVALAALVFMFGIATSSAQQTSAHKAVKKTEKAVKDNIPKTSEVLAQSAKKENATVKTEKASKSSEKVKNPTLFTTSKMKRTAVVTEKSGKDHLLAKKYNGQAIYTGTQGGQYYINSDGNKTYIQIN